MFKNMSNHEFMLYVIDYSLLMKSHDPTEYIVIHPQPYLTLVKPVKYSEKNCNI